MFWRYSYVAVSSVSEVVRSLVALEETTVALVETAVALTGAGPLGSLLEDFLEWRPK